MASSHLNRLLMKKDEETKIAAMKVVVSLACAGKAPDVLMTVINHVIAIARDSKQLLRLALLYFENIDRLNEKGELRDEFVMAWCVGLLLVVLGLD